MLVFRSCHHAFIQPVVPQRPYKGTGMRQCISKTTATAYLQGDMTILSRIYTVLHTNNVQNSDARDVLLVWVDQMIASSDMASA